MTGIPRRRFLQTAAWAGAVGAGTGRLAAVDLSDLSSLQATGAVAVSTWPFGRPANEKALQILRDGGSGIDAVEQGIRVVEADAGNPSVGLGGIPNAEGVVQLDACLMVGPGHRAGSVAALEGFRHPISIARRIMETTRHVMLVGDGAARFAAQHGFERGPKISGNQRAAWQKWRREQAASHRAPAPSAGGPTAKPLNHDTIALVLLGQDGNLYGGCSTSGWGYKLAGRVGDSPILGSGLYVDNEIGAAGATGVGENVMRYCGSFLVVEYIRQGLHPQDACLETIRRIARMDPLGFNLSINFVAVDKRGRYGAAGTGSGFQYSVACKEYSKVLQSPGLTANDIGPVGGNRK